MPRLRLLMLVANVLAVLCVSASDALAAHATRSAAPSGVYVYNDGWLQDGVVRNGLQVFSLGDHRLVKTGQMLAVRDPVTFGVFSPDGKLEARSVTPVGGPTAMIVRTPGVRPYVRRLIRVAGIPLAFTADDKTLAFLMYQAKPCVSEASMKVALLSLGSGTITVTPLLLRLSPGTTVSDCGQVRAQAAFSADGRALLYTNDTDYMASGAILRGDLSDGSISTFARPGGVGWLEAPTLSRDGNTLAFLRFRPSITTSPAAEQLVIARPDGTTLMTVALGRATIEGPGGNGDLQNGGLALSPDGQTAIVSCPSGIADGTGHRMSIWTLCRVGLRTGSIKRLGGRDLVPLAWRS